MLKRPYFIVKLGKNGKYYWLLESRNGRSLLRSTKGYRTKQNAQKSIVNVINKGIDRANYEIETANIDGNGSFYTLLGRHRTIKQYGVQTTERKKLAISGNGKNYHSVNWQICEIGVNKGINASIKNIQVIAEKIKSGKPWLKDETK